MGTHNYYGHRKNLCHVPVKDPMGKGHQNQRMSGLLKTRLIAPYQHDGVRWLVQRESAAQLAGGFLCDEMGLGKTVQMLATMLVNAKPHTLVIAPKSVVGQWVSEIKRFAPSLTVGTFDGPKRAVPTVLPSVLVAPYSVLGERITKRGGVRCPLLDVAWDRVILDEGHEIRNKKSKVHVACRALMAPIRWILSGTPVFNSMKDFVALCAFVGLNSQMVQGYTDDVRAKYVLRRTKADVAKFNPRLALPPCDFENLELEMYPEEQALYEEVFDRGAQVVASVARSGAAHLYQMELLEALLRARQAMIWPQMYLDGVAVKMEQDPERWTGRSRKFEALLDLVASHPAEKSLVFTQFMGEMDELQERFTTLGVPVLRIDGSVAKEARDERIAAFRASTSQPAPVFLIQIKAGGVGLNLQEATRVYITAPSWNPATELQAIGRAHRTGQTRKVTVRRLIYVAREVAGARPSVEQSIMQLQEGKARICAEVLNDPRVMDQVPNAPKTKVNIQMLRKIFAV